MNDLAADMDDRDARLSEALGLLSSTSQRSRHGLLSLAALIGLAVSGTLLATLLTGIAEPKKPLKMNGMPAAASADFELSASPSQAEPHAGNVREAVLIATER
jgi:hypothetical protein